MLQITRVLENLVLPPGGLILLVVIGLIFLVAKRRRVAAAILTAALLATYLLSIGPIAGAIMVPLENSYPALSPAVLSKDDKGASGPDAVVILGGGSVAGAPDAPSIAQMAGKEAQSSGSPVSLSADAAARLAYGFAVSRALGLPIIVAGGAPLKPAATESEAQASKALLAAMGADPAQVQTETRSRTTWENAVNVALEYHPKRIVLVTSAYHMRRAVYCFQKQGIDVIPAPTNYTVNREPGSGPDFMPTAYALQTSSTAIRERIAMLFYRLRYGAVPK